jgi:hypothetical protein
MTDYSSATQSPASNSAARAQAVVAGDTIVGSRALYVGTGGDIVLTMFTSTGGTHNVTFVGVPSGSVLPVYARAIVSTTASNIVALW